MLDPLSSSFSLNTGSSAANSARNSIFLSAVSLNENEVEKPDMKSNYQQKIFELTESVGFGVIIFVFIFINTIVISFEVSEESDRYYGYYLQSIDSICVGIFILELFLRIFAWRTKFFNSWWHTFDLFLVILSLTTIILPHISITFQSPNVLALIRMARSLRIIRTVRTLGKFQFVKSIKMIIDTLMHSVQAMSVILFVSVIVFYIYTVLGVLAFSKVDPYRFQSLSSSYVVFLQVLSLDLWSDTAIDNKQVAPGMLYMFYSFIIIQAFVLLNLLTAVIVDNLAALRKNIGHHMKKSKKWSNLAKKSYTKMRKNKSRIIRTENQEESLNFDQYYSKDTPWKSKELITSYLMNLAALEHNMNLHSRHEQLLEELVGLLQKDKLNN